MSKLCCSTEKIPNPNYSRAQTPHRLPFQHRLPRLLAKPGLDLACSLAAQRPDTCSDLLSRLLREKKETCFAARPLPGGIYRRHSAPFNRPQLVYGRLRVVLNSRFKPSQRPTTSPSRPGKALAGSGCGPCPVGFAAERPAPSQRTDPCPPGAAKAPRAMSGPGRRTVDFPQSYSQSLLLHTSTCISLPQPASSSP